MDQKINAKLHLRNDSIYFKGDDNEIFLNPIPNGFSVILLDNEVKLYKISGSRVDEISKKIDSANKLSLE